MNKTIKIAAIDSLATALYIILVASFMFYIQKTFPNNLPIVLIPIAMLLLFVFSAALTGFLVFGKPVMLYLDGKKKQARSLLGYTLGFLLIITILVFIILISYANLFS